MSKTARKVNVRTQSASPVDACELTILMPCLNEAETIGACVKTARAFLQSSGIDGEVLIADNGSSDGSREIAAACGARVVGISERGYGSALRGGIAAARGRYIIMGDADESYDFAALDPFVEKLRAGFDLVMGNRFLGGIAPGAMPWLHKYLGNPVLTGVGRLFFGSKVGDFHCGLRGFDRDAIGRLGLASAGMEFASEMVVKATLQKLCITEVPSTLAPDSRSRPPHLRSWRDGWRHLRFLLLFSPRRLFLYPGLTLMAIGVLAMLWLLPGPRRIGAVVFDVHTLAYGAAAIICGFQAAAFAVLAKVYAINARLLPRDRRISRLGDIFTLELGIVIGLMLLLAGLATSLYAVGVWGRGSFAGLDPSTVMRVVLPAITAVVLGLQAVFFSFFLSVLGLVRR